MEEEIKKYLLDHNFTYIEIKNPESLNIIYDLLINDKIIEDLDTDDPIIYLYYCVYFSFHQNYEKMTKYCKVAIEVNTKEVVYSLINYYQKDDEMLNMSKYCDSIISKKRSLLGGLIFCFANNKKWPEFKKYSLMTYEQGDYGVCYLLATYYRNIEKNYDEMAKYSIEIMINKNKEYFDVALKLFNYYCGIVSKNNPEALECAEIGIKNGSATFMNNMGFYCIVKKNYDEAKKYFLGAIENGSVEAIHKLCTYYDTIEKNYDEVAKYSLMIIEKNIERYLDRAINNLEHYYIKCKQDNVESKKYCEMGVKRGNITSINNMGIYYFYEGNYEEAKKYILMGVEKDDVTSLFNLGYYYKKIEKNYDEMVKYYDMAANRGDIQSINGLIKYYSKKYDFENAKKYALIGVSCGDVESMLIVAQFYGSEQNYDKMKEYLLMAIGKKNIEAIKKMAEHYQYTEKNYDEMKIYYQMAIDYGDISAIIDLGFYYQNIKNYEEMKKYYLTAIEKGSSDAMHRIGYYYETSENYDKMTEYYSMGSNIGNKKCIDRINWILERRFDLTLALSGYNNLSHYNMATLNNILCQFNKVNPDLINNAMYEIECIICYKFDKCVFFKCGHAICINCYGKHPCRLCGDVID